MYWRFLFPFLLCLKAYPWAVCLHANIYDYIRIPVDRLSDSECIRCHIQIQTWHTNDSIINGAQFMSFAGMKMKKEKTLTYPLLSQFILFLEHSWQ